MSWPEIVVRTTRYVTNFTTKYAGVITKFFTVVTVMNDKGEPVPVTKVVSAVTAYYDSARNALVRDIRDVAREAKRYVSV